MIAPAFALAAVILRLALVTLGLAWLLASALARAAEARDTLPDGLRQRDAAVDDVPLYETRRPAQPDGTACKRCEPSLRRGNVKLPRAGVTHAQAGRNRFGHIRYRTGGRLLPAT